MVKTLLYFFILAFAFSSSALRDDNGDFIEEGFNYSSLIRLVDLGGTLATTGAEGFHRKKEICNHEPVANRTSFGRDRYSVFSDESEEYQEANLFGSGASTSKEITTGDYAAYGAIHGAMISPRGWKVSTKLCKKYANLGLQFGLGHGHIGGNPAYRAHTDKPNPMLARGYVEVNCSQSRNEIGTVLIYSDQTTSSGRPGHFETVTSNVHFACYNKHKKDKAAGINCVKEYKKKGAKFELMFCSDHCKSIPIDDPKYLGNKRKVRGCYKPNRRAS